MIKTRNKPLKANLTNQNPQINPQIPLSYSFRMLETKDSGEQTTHNKEPFNPLQSSNRKADKNNKQQTFEQTRTTNGKKYFEENLLY